MTQFKLIDFDGLPEVSLTLSVAKLVSAGWSLRKIARHLKLKNHQNVAYHRDKAVRQRILRKTPLGWELVDSTNHSCLTASKKRQKLRPHSSEERRLTAKVNARWNNVSKTWLAGGSGERELTTLHTAPRQRWGKHFVKGVFGFKRAPDFEKVRGLADRVVRVKPEQYVFYDGNVTLTVRSRSVRVDVFGCEGGSPEEVLEQARARVRVKLADFMDSFGCVLREGSFSTSCRDWTLDKGLSAFFLRFKPDLADASHPKQVEVDDVVKARIDALLDGRIEARIEGIVSVLEKLKVGSFDDWRRDRV